MMEMIQNVTNTVKAERWATGASLLTVCVCVCLSKSLFYYQSVEGGGGVTVVGWLRTLRKYLKSMDMFGLV